MVCKIPSDNKNSMVNANGYFLFGILKIYDNILLQSMVLILLIKIDYECWVLQIQTSPKFYLFQTNDKRNEKWYPRLIVQTKNTFKPCDKDDYKLFDT